MTKYKIIFIDIDDTLNPADKEVSSYTKKVMKELKEQGIIIVINSGRSVSYAVEKSLEAGLSDYVIASNGSEIYNHHERKEIFSKPISKKDIKGIYEYCEEHDLTLILNSMENRYININDYSYNNEPAIYFDNLDKVLKDNKINQLIVLSSNYDRMLVLPPLFKEKFPNLKVVHSSKALVDGKRIKGKEYYHDLVINNTSKGSGITELLDYLKIEPEEAICIGNGYDDIPMCDVVGTSIAVADAHELLKEVSTYICDTAANDGPAKILKELCLNKKGE